MPRVLVTPSPQPPSGTSSTSELGPALRLRGLRPPLTTGSYKPSLVDIGLLGFTTVVGGQYVRWNAVLAAGLIPAVMAFTLVTGAYVVLIFSLAEIASVFPFTGGAYAVARKTLGLFGGFLMGAIDVLESITYVSAAVLTFAQLVVIAVPQARGFEPLVWLSVFVSIAVLQTRSCALFWRTNAVLALSTLGLLVFFGVGSLPRSDFRANTTAVMDIHSRITVNQPSLTVLLRVLPFVAWFYVGTDKLVLVADQLTDSKVILPRAQRGCILLLIATAILTFLMTCAIPPSMGTTTDALAPLTFGLATLSHLSFSHATWFSVPATYASAFGFAWAYGRLITALATSGLVPRGFAATIQQHQRRKTTFSGPLALGTGSLVSFIVCFIVHYGHRPLYELTNFCLGLAFLSYMGQCLGYITLQRNGRSLVRSMSPSPFGIMGAYVSLVIWILCFVAIMGFQDTEFVELLVVFVLLIVLSLYYAFYAQHHQLFSADERDVTLAASTQGSKSAARKTPSPPLASSSATAPSSKDSKPPDNDGSFRGTGPTRTSSGSLRMPQLVRAGSKLNNLVEEHAEVVDDIYDAPKPSLRHNTMQDVLSASFSNDSQSSQANPFPIRRAGSDSALASSVMSTPIVVVPVSTPPVSSSFLSGGFGRSFLVRNGRRLERLREETDRDLRSAMSGIWSERSQHWSRGRAS